MRANALSSLFSCSNDIKSRPHVVFKFIDSNVHGTKELKTLHNFKLLLTYVLLNFKTSNVIVKLFNRLISVTSH